jgi:hypothetical protein
VRFIVSSLEVAIGHSLAVVNKNCKSKEDILYDAKLPSLGSAVAASPPEIDKRHWENETQAQNNCRRPQVQSRGK